MGGVSQVGSSSTWGRRWLSTNIETLHEGMDGSPKIVWFVDFWEHVKIARSWVRGVRKALVGESMVPHSVISVRRFVIHRAQKTSEMCWWGWSLNPSPKTPGKNENSLCNIRAYRNIPKHCDWPVAQGTHSCHLHDQEPSIPD